MDFPQDPFRRLRPRGNGLWTAIPGLAPCRLHESRRVRRAMCPIRSGARIRGCRLVVQIKFSQSAGPSAPAGGSRSLPRSVVRPGPCDPTEIHPSMDIARGALFLFALFGGLFLAAWLWERFV